MYACGHGDASNSQETRLALCRAITIVITVVRTRTAAVRVALGVWRAPFVTALCHARPPLRILAPVRKRGTPGLADCGSAAVGGLLASPHGEVRVPVGLHACDHRRRRRCVACGEHPDVESLVVPRGRVPDGGDLRGTGRGTS